MNLKPLFTVQTGVTSSGTSNSIKISNPSLFGASTSHTSSSSSGNTTLYVRDSTGFVANDLILIGQPNSSNAEVRRISSTTATTIVVGVAVSYYHSAGDPITVVPYNAYTIEKATYQNGTYSTVVADQPLDFTSLWTIYQDRASTPSTWYRVSFKDSLNSKTSGVSDPVQGNGYNEKTLEYIVNSVRNSTGNSSLPDDFFVGAVNEARRVLNTNLGYGLANAWRAEFNYPITLLAGNSYVDLPSNIDFDETNRSIMGVRFGRASSLGGYPLVYKDKRQWNLMAYQNVFATLASDVLGNGTATTITLNNSGDFNTTGTVIIGTSQPRESVISSSYSGNDLTTNVLSGLSGLTRSIATFTVTIASPGIFTCANHGLVEGDPICFTTDGALPTGLNTTSVFYVTGTSLTSSTFTVSATLGGDIVNTSGTQSGTHTLYKAIPAGTQVWAFQTNAIPCFYTVFNSTINGVTKRRIWFETPIPTTLRGRLVYVDYYKKLQDVRSLSDELSEPFRDCYADYIRYAMKRRRDDTISETDIDFQKFINGVKAIVGNTYTGQGVIAITG